MSPSSCYCRDRARTTALVCAVLGVVAAALIGFIFAGAVACATFGCLSGLLTTIQYFAFRSMFTGAFVTRRAAESSFQSTMSPECEACPVVSFVPTSTAPAQRSKFDAPREVACRDTHPCYVGQSCGKSDAQCQTTDEEGMTSCSQLLLANPYSSADSSKRAVSAISIGMPGSRGQTTDGNELDNDGVHEWQAAVILRVPDASLFPAPGPGVKWEGDAFAKAVAAADEAALSHGLSPMYHDPLNGAAVFCAAGDTAGASTQKAASFAKDLPWVTSRMILAAGCPGLSASSVWSVQMAEAAQLLELCGHLRRRVVIATALDSPAPDACQPLTTSSRPYQLWTLPAQLGLGRATSAGRLHDRSDHYESAALAFSKLTIDDDLVQLQRQCWCLISEAAACGLSNVAELVSLGSRLSEEAVSAGCLSRVGGSPEVHVHEQPASRREDTWCIRKDLRVFEPTLQSKYGLYAVFDGHAGAEVAHYCRALIPPEVARRISLGFLPAAALKSALEAVGRRVLKHMEPREVEGGTTATVLLLTDDSIYTASLGDSRAIGVVRSAHDVAPQKVHPPCSPMGDTARPRPSALSLGSITTEARQPFKAVGLTRDHSASDPFERGCVHALGGLVMHTRGSDRVDGVLQVTRSIGDPRVTVNRTPDVSLFSRDDFETVVIASDGLWKVYGADAVATVVGQSRDCIDAGTDLSELESAQAPSSLLSAPRGSKPLDYGAIPTGLVLDALDMYQTAPDDITVLCLFFPSQAESIGPL
eukprot:TRINITY_DN5547_c0_g2_i1.p1 TRINITY_DN5547_c0_g2~~TRINITY_DN5547_c0_g2_i1.p1  ORF type:complete len:760 (+),score=114.49 TRINITY_DN5547_c0_g2_i1:45-2324(+)